MSPHTTHSLHQWKEDLPLIDSEPKKVRGVQHYDIVLNGVELGGGSIRIHQPDVQEDFEDVLKIPADVVKSRFGYMLESFEYGAPPPWRYCPWARPISHYFGG